MSEWMLLAVFAFWAVISTAMGFKVVLWIVAALVVGVVFWWLVGAFPAFFLGLLIWYFLSSLTRGEQE